MTSFNLCAALLKHYNSHICNVGFSFIFNNNLDTKLTVPLSMILYNMNSYFPNLQIEWSSNKMDSYTITEYLEKEEYNKLDILFKYNNEYLDDIETQKRRAIKFHPYSKKKINYISSDPFIKADKKNINPDRPDRNNRNNTEFLQQLTMIDLTISDSI